MHGVTVTTHVSCGDDGSGVSGGGGADVGIVAVVLAIAVAARV